MNIVIARWYLLSVFTMIAFAEAHYHGEKSKNFLSTNVGFFFIFVFLNTALLSNSILYYPFDFTARIPSALFLSLLKC